MLAIVKGKPPLVAGTIRAHPIACAAAVLLVLAGVMLGIPAATLGGNAEPHVVFCGVWGSVRTFVFEAVLLTAVLAAYRSRLFLPLSCAALMLDGALAGFGFGVLVRCGEPLWAALDALPGVAGAASLTLGFAAAVGRDGDDARNMRLACGCLFMLLLSAAAKGGLAALMCV